MAINSFGDLKVTDVVAGTLGGSGSITITAAPASTLIGGPSLDTARSTGMFLRSVIAKRDIVDDEEFRRWLLSSVTTQVHDAVVQAFLYEKPTILIPIGVEQDESYPDVIQEKWIIQGVVAYIDFHDAFVGDWVWTASPHYGNHVIRIDGMTFVRHNVSTMHYDLARSDYVLWERTS